MLVIKCNITTIFFVATPKGHVIRFNVTIIVAQPEEVEISSDQFTEVMKSHASSQISGEHRNIVVSRASIWTTALPYFKRKKFAGGKHLIHVTFANFEEEEDAIDLGGPRREFLHLLLGAICKDSKTVKGTVSLMSTFVFHLFHPIHEMMFMFD